MTNDYYPPKDGAVVTYEQNIHAVMDCGIAVGRTPEVLPDVTPEEEEEFNRMGALE